MASALSTPTNTSILSIDITKPLKSARQQTSTRERSMCLALYLVILLGDKPRRRREDNFASRLPSSHNSKSLELASSNVGCPKIPSILTGILVGSIKACQVKSETLHFIILAEAAHRG